MLYADVATSPRRNLAFLTPAQRSTFAPSPSEAASRAIHARMAPSCRTVDVLIDNKFAFGYVLEAGDSIPADGGGITYVVVDALIAAERLA